LGYFFQRGRKILFTDPYKTISLRACIVIETVDLQSFMNSLTTGKGLFGEIGKVSEFDSFNRKVKFLADQFNKPGFKKLLGDGSSLISLFPAQDGTLQPLLSLTVSGEVRTRQIKELLHSSGIKEVSERKLNGSQVIMIPFIVNTRPDTVYLSLLSGLMICSTSEKLIEEARAQTGGENDIRKQPGFSRVLLAAGKNEDKIFIVFNNLTNLFNSFLKVPGSGLAEMISRLAGTAGGDIYINEDGIVLSGYTDCKDSSDYLYRYKSLTPSEFHTYKILPSSTVLFETLILPPDKQLNISDTSVSKAVAGLADKLKEYLGEEITKAYIDIKERPVGDNTLIILELANRVEAEKIFLEELGPAKEIIYFAPDDQSIIPVYKTSFRGLIKVIMPGLSPGFDDTYYAFYDNYIISGSSYATISRLLYDNILNKTLANDLVYRDFESTLPSRAGYFFYCVPSRILDYLAGFLNDDIIKGLRQNKLSLNKIQAAGFQFVSSNGMIYNSLSVKFKEEAREESTTEWETLLDTIAAIKPFFFTNHTTGAKEIFIQDIKNNTYLINAAGRVLWKVPLKERINGSIYMVDYFRNGKLQLLFSGKDYLHLLDRNGNYVQRYPVKLRSPATNSISLFDYDNNRNYRLFIAGEDKLIYSYDKTGNVVKGWTPFRTSGKVMSDIVYFKVSGKDFLVACDETSVYFLDRSGKKRINLKEPVTKARGSAIRLSAGSDPFLVCTAPDGMVQQIYFDGSVRKFSLMKASIDHSFDFFDVDGDGFGEYVFIENGMLYLYDHNKTEIFTRKFELSHLGGPVSISFSASDRKIGVFDIDNKLIYLIGKNGETMNGFPLRGASMFSIGKLSDKSGWHLIVGGTDRFLYNYKIETEAK
jgi:WD40 repeat protein